MNCLRVLLNYEFRLLRYNTQIIEYKWENCKGNVKIVAQYFIIESVY